MGDFGGNTRVTTGGTYSDVAGSTSGAKLHVCIALTVFWGGSRYVGRFGRLDAIDALGYDGPRTHNSSWRMNQAVLTIPIPIPI